MIDEIVYAIKKAETQLSEDTVKALKEAYERETNPMGKTQLEAILKNVEVARKESLPMCQDTGLQTFFLEVGYDFPYMRELKSALVEAVRRATREIPLRPNAVHPFLHKNSGDNTGRFVPYIHWELKEGDDATIHVIPKGGGSENMSGLYMLSPGVGIKGIKKAVIEHIFKSGGKPCPPTIIGVGIGGGADLALTLAKKAAILRPIGVRHEEDFVAQLEEELYEMANKLGIGAMGLGGDTTVLDVHVEYAYRHPATLPVGIVTQCWANRRAKVHIDANGKVEVV
ncbi:MAG: fumarate hydratase [Thermoplasmata archaeon]|nr:fumarate hydratase [Thermoplasmata archaeon]